jgi:heme-degrading monooxygenase HmoA
VIQFEVRQKVSAENRAAYDEVVKALFVPAVSVQEGFISFRLLEEYPAEVQEKAGARSDGFNVVVQLTFESEEQRLKWVETPEHAKLGERLTGLMDDARATGYTIRTEEK